MRGRFSDGNLRTTNNGIACNKQYYGKHTALMVECERRVLEILERKTGGRYVPVGLGLYRERRAVASSCPSSFVSVSYYEYIDAWNLREFDCYVTRTTPRASRPRNRFFRVLVRVAALVLRQRD